MAHENPIISKIKLPQNETPYEICDKDAVHYDDDPVFALEDSQDIYTDIINADTLQGHPASYFATPAFVANKIAEAQLSGGNNNDIDLSGYATKDELNNLTAEDVGARPNTWMPSAKDVGARPADWMPTAEQVGARPSTWTPTAEDIGAAAEVHNHAYLATNNANGVVRVGYEANNNNGHNYYFRPDETSENDVYLLGSSVHPWDKAYIGDLTLTTALPITQGGTGATKAADALVNFGLTATAAELNYVDGVTSSIQTQLNDKAPSIHSHRELTVNEGNGVVRVGYEANNNNGTNYYLRPYPVSENDAYVLGSSSNPWKRAYIGDLTLTRLTSPLSVESGGTGATKAADARANLNAASLDSNTFTASQTIPNNSRFKSSDTAGTEVNLIGISNNDNIVIGGSANPKPVYVYGKMQLATDLAVEYGGTGASNPADARANLGFTGGITTAITNNFSTNRAIISNADGKLASSSVTSTELGYLDGVTSKIQTQLNGKADSSHTHRNLKANDGTGTVILGNETNSSGGSNYYLRPDGEGTNDAYYFGTSGHPWSKGYMGTLSLTGNQTLANNAKIVTSRTDGTSINLIYMSSGDNLVIGSSDYTDTQPIIMYGNPDIRGYIKLDGSSYGSSLPTAGTKGRIFFKKVSS